MPKFNIKVPHTLSQEAATERLNGFVDILRNKFQDQVSDLEQSWEENTLRFGFKSYGIALKGGITVEEGSLDVEGDLPFAAMMFKGKIESSIREQLVRLVGDKA